MNFVGNDLVDLGEPANRGRAGHRALVEKICTPAERDAIAKAEEPDRCLWSFWAAKEAVYKVRRKDQAVAFRPVAIEVFNHSAVWNGRYFHLAWEQGSDWVHCSAWDPVSEGLRLETGIAAIGEDLGGTLSEREAAAISSLASRQVRLLAKRQLQAHGYESAGLEILRFREGAAWGPPRVYYRDRWEKAIDISLSHDGNYVAVCFLREV
jgi:phosphopantetheinyl transferase (holo-ACP synthase)